MAAPKGNHNNPTGRPPKSKALTNMLEIALGATHLYNGKKASGKRILADMVSNALVTGRVRFPADTTDSIISIRDWIELVKWTYERVDGKPVQPLSGSDGGAIQVEYVNSPYPTTDVSSEPGENTSELKQV
jgi:hypothetical protein